MKKLTLILALFLSTFPELFAQNQDTTFLIEEYLRQSEKQKKSAIILMGAGAGAMALGLIIASSSDWDSSAFGGGIVLFFAGSASVVLGIPIIVSSASKARKAGQLSLGLNSARVIQPKGSSLTTYLALKYSIPLNSLKR